MKVDSPNSSELVQHQCLEQDKKYMYIKVMWSKKVTAVIKVRQLHI